MLENIRGKSIEVAIKVRTKRTEIINRAKNYINNNKGEIPPWGMVVLGLLGLAALLTIIVFGYKWATGNVEKTTNHIDKELNEWMK